MTDDTGEMHSRDMDMLGTDGPQATQFETPNARDQVSNMETGRDRPQYSPVAQPGQVEEIHWHTVRSDQPGQPEHEQPTRGMIRRFHPAQRERVVIREKEGRGQRKKR